MAPLYRLALLLAVLEVVCCYQYYTTGTDGCLRSGRSLESATTSCLTWPQGSAQYSSPQGASQYSASPASSQQTVYRVSRETHAESKPAHHQPTQENARGTRQTQEFQPNPYASAESSQDAAAYYHQVPNTEQIE